MDAGLTGALMEGADTVTGAGGKHGFVKVRETYDLPHRQEQDVGDCIHTPDSKIIKANFPLVSHAVQSIQALIPVM